MMWGMEIQAVVDGVQLSAAARKTGLEAAALKLRIDLDDMTDKEIDAVFKDGPVMLVVFPSKTFLRGLSANGGIQAGD